MPFIGSSSASRVHQADMFSMGKGAATNEAYQDYLRNFHGPLEPGHYGSWYGSNSASSYEISLMNSLKHEAMKKLAANPNSGYGSPGYSETLKNIFDNKVSRIDSVFSNTSPDSSGSSEGSSGGSSDPIVTPGGSYNPDPVNPEYEEDFSFGDYLSGLLSSVGDEAATNREYNSNEAAINREFQHVEADIQRRWYEEMSNSAYQRQVADLEAAGLNPILAYQQGGSAVATTGIPVGSAASHSAIGGDTVSSILSGIADIIGAFTGSALDLSKLKNLFEKKNGIGFKP